MSELDTLQDLLTKRPPFPPLSPKAPWNKSLSEKTAAAKIPALIKAGLYLLNDDIENCHLIAQQDESPIPNYWHAILHRREGDFENSKYWFRRALVPEVAVRMSSEIQAWDPLAFVDACQTKEWQSKKVTTQWLEEVQWLEMLSLLNHTLLTVEKR